MKEKEYRMASAARGALLFMRGVPNVALGDRVVLDNYQKHSYPLGIMVNLRAERFVDEGEDYRNLTYVKFGRAIMAQPHRTAR